jgi:hypothetical protein
LRTHSAGKMLMERYVEDGLNPDKYTRRFVNTLMKDNQYVNGKIDAVQVNLWEEVSKFQDFRDVLAEEIRKEFPELGSDVDAVIENTGGVREQKQQIKAENREKIEVD